MSSFPHDFDDQTQPLTADLLAGTDAELVQQLAEKGFEVHAGLTEAFASDITQMCLQPSIKEFCPNDSGSRFKDVDATKAWLGKGRGTFLLLKRDGGQLSLAGYGWAGDGTSQHVPGGQTTFAIRIGEQGQGQGLGTPFARLIVAGAATVYGARDFWLETWQSNGGAVHIYHKIGFEDVDQVDDSRPTADGDTVADTRLYMSLPNEALPA